VDGTGSGSHPAAGFGVNGVNNGSSRAIVLIEKTFMRTFRYKRYEETEEGRKIT
jgi:hypothetical protein